MKQEQTSRVSWWWLWILSGTFLLFVGCDVESQRGASVVPTSRRVEAVIGGVQDRRLPAVGALTDSGQSFCTGTLVASQLVLTAAHCIDSAVTARALAFRIEVPANNAQGYTYHTYSSTRVSSHPQWNQQVSLGNDVGFVILDNKVDPKHAVPMPYNTKALDSSFIGRNVQFLGYGLIQSTRTAAVSTPVKMGAEIPITRLQSDRFVTQTAGKSICHGDSGGPALMKLNGVWTVIGVNSYVSGSSAGSGRSACDGSGTCMRTDVYPTYFSQIFQKYGDPGCVQHSDCPSGQLCNQGKCEANPCGDGVCDATKGENCGTCAQDCGCPSGQQCQNNACIAQPVCGDGVCTASIGENCGTCIQDCGCPSGQICQNDICKVPDPCGDGVCDANIGESCGSCAKDCGCAAGQKCQNNACVDPCGDGVCDASGGENCGTCAKDCGCASGQQCQNNTCEAPSTPDSGPTGNPNPGTSCVATEDCPANHICKRGLCTPLTSQPLPCTQSADCAVGLVCQQGQCVMASNDVPGPTQPPNTAPPAGATGQLGGPCREDNTCDGAWVCFLSAAKVSSCLPADTPASSQLCPSQWRAETCLGNGQCTVQCLSPKGTGCQIGSHNTPPSVFQLLWLLLLLPLCRRKSAS